MPDTRHIGISLGNQHSFVDGLGEFSRQLCTRFAAQAPRLREERGWVFHIYLPEEQHGVFGPEVQYLAPTRRHYRWHTQVPRFALWHTVQQLNRYPPPRGTAHRLLTVHDLNFFYFKNAYSKRRDAWHLSRVLKRSDTLVTISAYVGQDVRERMGWTKDIQVIHNGARDLSGFAAGARARGGTGPLPLSPEPDGGVQERGGLAGHGRRLAGDACGACRAGRPRPACRA